MEVKASGVQAATALSETLANVLGGGPTAEYAYFLWRLNKALPAMRALLDQATAASPHEIEVKVPDDDRMRSVEDHVPLLFYVAANSIRSDIGRIVQHNCAGAVLQIAQTIFERYIDALPLLRQEPQGQTIKDQPFSRVLWASRNAYVHGDEWRVRAEANRNQDPRARMSIGVLTSVGIADPTRVNALELLQVITDDGGVDELRRRMIRAAKEALAKAGAHAKGTGQSSLIPELKEIGGVLIVFAIMAGLEWWLGNREPVDGIMLVAVRDGDEILAVPVAAGGIKSPIQLTRVLRETAVEHLPPHLAKKYHDFEAAGSTLIEKANELAALDPEDGAFTDQLLLLCTLADDLYERNKSLPDPIAELNTVWPREVSATPAESMHAILSTLLQTRGFIPKEYQPKKVPPSLLPQAAAELFKENPS